MSKKKKKSATLIASKVASDGSRIHIETNRNWEFSFDSRELPELNGANADQLAEMRITDGGRYIEWTTPAARVRVGKLLGELLGEEFLISEGNRRVAAHTSARKAASSAANGKLGGRPPKKDHAADGEASR